MSARDKALDAWGAEMPDWVAALADACDRSSQNKVARALDRSPALVSTVLGRTYKGDMQAVEDIVRGVFMKGTVMCPAYGELPLHDCRKWRGRARTLQNVNSHWVRMYRACNSCPIHTKTEDAPHVPETTDTD